MNENQDDKQFSQIAWTIAVSTARETCESPQEIYRRLMLKRQQNNQDEQTE